MKYSDIKKFTKRSSYQVDVSFDRFIDNIERYTTEYGLILNPDFQRGHVWKETQQIKYIEYILAGGNTGKIIYLNKPDWMSFKSNFKGYNDFVVVDGLQRITAMKRFMNNEIKVYDTLYKEFTGHVDTRTGFQININDLQTKSEVLRWYLEMNSGGTPHTKEELDKVQQMLIKELK